MFVRVSFDHRVSAIFLGISIAYWMQTGQTVSSVYESEPTPIHDASVIIPEWLTPMHWSETIAVAASVCLRLWFTRDLWRFTNVLWLI